MDTSEILLAKASLEVVHNPVSFKHFY